MTKGWLRGWKSRHWSRANNQYLKNADLWKRLDAASSGHEITWRWVKGHAGHIENERCDALANAACQAPGLPRDPGFDAEEARQQSQQDLL